MTIEFLDEDASEPTSAIQPTKRRVVFVGEEDVAEVQPKQVGTSFAQELQQIGPAFVESLGRPLENMGESFQAFGFQGVADALKGAITEPENYVSASQRFIEPEEGEAKWGFAWQYAPRAAVEQAGQAIGSLATRVAGGLAGLPLGPAGAAAGAFVGPAIFEAAQIIGPVAKERAKNNGREVPTNEDLVAATITAAGSGALNAIGARYLPGGEKATGKFFKRVASSFLGEAATEAPQSIVEQVGSTAGTVAGLNINYKQALGEGLIGGVTGAGLTGITAPFTKPAENQVIRTPEQAEEIEIDAKANEEAVSLMGAPADQAKNEQISKVKELESVIANNEMLSQALEPNTPEAQRLKLESQAARDEIEKTKVGLEEAVGLTPTEDVNAVQSRIEQAKVQLTGVEPTSRKARTIETQIAQDEAKLKALSEPIAVAEAEQARLAEEIAAPIVEAAPVEPTPVAEVTPTEEAEFAELRNLMERKGQSENKVAGVKFSKKDEARYNELLPKYRSRLLETITPESDPVIWKDIEGNDIKVSKKGTFYTVENGRIRTGPAFQSEGFIKDVSPQPVSAAVVESNNVPLPEGYTKQGDLYVYQPTATPITTQAVTEAVTPAAEQPAASIPTSGKPFEFFSIRNKEKAPRLGTQFGQDVEPSGKYISQSTPDAAKNLDARFEKKTVRFENPLVIEFGGEYGTPTNWKNILSSQYGGKTGKELSQAIRDAGYDGIVTVEPAKGPNRPASTSEIVDISSLKPKKKPAAPAAPTTGIAVGSRIKLGKSPQTYTIEEVLPQSATERELGEQYYSVKNERTGDVQTVEAGDITAIKKQPIRKRKGEAGGVIIPSRQDWLDFAESIYEAGMSFADWSKKMLARFGEAVRSALQQIWDQVGGFTLVGGGMLPQARERGAVRFGRGKRSKDVEENIKQSNKIESVTNKTLSGLGNDVSRDYNAYINEGKSEAQIAEENKTNVNQVRINILKGRKAVGEAIKKAKIDTKAKPENTVVDWTTNAAKKYLTKEGNLPGGTFQKWVKRNAKLAKEAEEVRQATEDFYDGLRKIYNINKIRYILEGLSSIPPEDVARFNDALAGEIPINEMPAEIQEPLTRMRQHIDAMSAELIATGQLPEYLEAKATNNLGVYLTRSYKIFSDPNWINKIPQEKLTAARNFLYQQELKRNPEFTIEDADRKLEQMLNDWSGEKDMDGKRGGRLGAKDLSVMMTRADVPKQLRDVMGENTNIIFNYANTIAKISRFVADQQFLDAVKQEGAGKFLYTKDNAPQGFNTLIAPEESRTMAPLSGLRTTPEIAKAFEEFGKAYDASANPFLYAFGWLNAAGKANLTVGSILTQMRNIIGQPFFFLGNGHASIGAINEEVNRLMKSKNLTKDQARNELVKMAAGEGLVGENAYAGELKEAFEQIGLKTFEDMEADEFSRQFVALRLFKKGTQGAQRLYQKTDEIGKMIGWLNETKRIQKMNPTMSREDAMAIAAERTRNTYPTYSQSSEVLRLFRRQPFFGPFATFFYETYRTTYWNVRYAFEDINSGTKAGREEGIKRLAGTMAQISIGSFLVNTLSAMVAGIGDKEEEDVRRMLPPWAADAALLWFPKTKDGVYDFINFSYINPYSGLTDPFVAMMSGFARGEDPTDIFVQAAGTFLSPFTSEQPVTAATVDAMRNMTETGAKVYNVEDDLGTKTSKILLHIFGKAFTPGTIDRLRKRIIPAIYGETVGTRAPAPLKEISAELTGIRFENLDMRSAFQNKAWEFSRAQNDSERIFRDVATRRRRVTEDQQVEAYRKSEQSRYENWQEMYRNYIAVRRAGASKEEAIRLMTDIKISRREANLIANGKYKPYEVSDEVRRRSKLNGNTIPLEQIKQIGKEMPRVLEDVK